MKIHSAITVFSLCLFAAAVPARAQSATDLFSGTYENKGSYWQKVVISRNGKTEDYIGQFDVATRGCQGDVKMSGSRKGSSSLVFSRKDPSMTPEVCIITVAFSSDRKSVNVSHEYCGYSGAACDFNGRLKRVSR